MPTIDGVTKYLVRCYRDREAAVRVLKFKLGELKLPDLKYLELLAAIELVEQESEMLGSMRRLLGDLKALGPHGRVAILTAKGPGVPQDERSPNTDVESPVPDPER